MKRVTRNIDPGSARAGLARIPRACFYFASDHGLQAQLSVLVWQDGRYLASIPQHADRKPGPAHEVVLLIDEGVHCFDLRAIYIRGQIKQATVPPEVPVADCMWLEAVPLKTVTWITERSER